MMTAIRAGDSVLIPSPGPLSDRGKVERVSNWGKVLNKPKRLGEPCALVANLTAGGSNWWDVSVLRKDAPAKRDLSRGRGATTIFLVRDRIDLDKVHVYCGKHRYLVATIHAEFIEEMFGAAANRLFCRGLGDCLELQVKAVAGTTQPPFGTGSAP